MQSDILYQVRQPAVFPYATDAVTLHLLQSPMSWPATLAGQHFNVIITIVLNQGRM